MDPPDFLPGKSMNPLFFSERFLLRTDSEIYEMPNYIEIQQLDSPTVIYF